MALVSVGDLRHRSHVTHHLYETRSIANPAREPLSKDQNHCSSE
ncbi:hypothetical protein [Agrobacterium vitis]|nr:hypothetical protein [Agrobacterium vitis]